MNTIEQTDDFRKDLQALPSPIRAHILSAVVRMQTGNFGDSKSVGAGVSELRVHKGPGYRVYYTRVGNTIYLMLCAGDKSSQQKDILRAQKLKERMGG